MKQNTKGYQRPAVLKSIPLEFESLVLADSQTTVPSSIKTVGQPVESMDFTDGNTSNFNFTWE